MLTWLSLMHVCYAVLTCMLPPERLSFAVTRVVQSAAVPRSVQMWSGGQLAPANESSAAATFETDNDKPDKNAG